MKLLSAFWRYWKWLCVALMTSFVILALLAAILHFFKQSAPSHEIGACIDAGGIWDEEAGHCKTAA